MRLRLLPAFAALALLPSPAVAQYDWNALIEACDPARPEICSYADLEARGNHLWITAGPSGRTVSTMYLLLTIPGVFHSQLSSEVPASLGSWWFSLDGGKAEYGRRDFYLSGSDDAYGIFGSAGVFHFLLQSPMHVADAATASMEFVGLRLWNPELDGYLPDDYVRGSGSASAVNITQVAPEPMTLALFGSGLLAIAAVQLRRRRKRDGKI